MQWVYQDTHQLHQIRGFLAHWHVHHEKFVLDVMLRKVAHGLNDDLDYCSVFGLDDAMVVADKCKSSGTRLCEYQNILSKREGKLNGFNWGVPNSIAPRIRGFDLVNNELVAVVDNLEGSLTFGVPNN
eukprot:1110816-Amorphochlora_amoeboformis.AAC.1